MIDEQIELAVSVRKEIESQTSSKDEFQKMKLKVDDILHGVPLQIKEELERFGLSSELSKKVSMLSDNQRKVFITFLHVAHN